MPHVKTLAPRPMQGSPGIRASAASVSPPLGLDLPSDMALLAIGGIAADLVITAAAEAERIAAAPLDVLLCTPGIRDGEVVAILSQELGTRLALSLADLPGIDNQSLADPDAAMQAGVIWMAAGGQTLALVAVRGRAVEKLADLLQATPELAARVILTPSRVFSAYVRRQAAAEIAARVCSGPAALNPQLAAANLDLAPGPFALAAVVLAILVLASPSVTAALIELALAVVFLVHGLLRMMALGTPPPCRPRRRLADRALPTYTLLVPSYREACVLPDLVATIGMLDYPPAKLQVLLLLESDDRETIAAADALGLQAPFEIVIVPASGPKTKPKALNYGLVGARGRLLAVFDAEDRPEPMQLRMAAHRLWTGPPDLACVQAALAIDNARPRPLARLFVLDYAALFDVFLPALGAMRLPFLLGGTSNHFRTDILKRSGGWDPLNVTEDADLGIRLARLGYRVESIASTTYEEAPAELWPWIRQRTRWMKGFLVTWGVHARCRRTLAADLGWKRAVAAELLLATTPLAALAHFGLLFIVPAQLAAGQFLTSTSTLSLAADTLTLTALCIGYAAAFLLTWQGLVRRRLRRLAPWMALLPVYWCLMAVAAARAISQLGRSDRGAWEKTEHGREARPPLQAAAGRPRAAGKVRSRSAG